MVKHGSHAYGLNTPDSDEDYKGVCIPPKEAYLGFTQKFEQHEHMGSKSDGVDTVVFALNKFAALAVDCNPNIIEILFVDDSDVVKVDRFGEQLRAMRDSFLSKKARHTFSGYAHAQLKRIKTHRKWLLDPPQCAPMRSDFGLSATSKVSKSELGAFDSLLDLQTIDDAALATPIQQAVAIGLIAQDKLGVELPKDVVTLFTREKAYRAAETHYAQYLNWKRTRNPKRAALEEKFGFDTKHACHLIRLMRMSKEILALCNVFVKRPDRDELLAIRRGERSYDSIIEEAERLDVECAALYDTSTLRREPNRAAIDKFVVQLTYDYLLMHG